MITISNGTHQCDTDGRTDTDNDSQMPGKQNMPRHNRGVASIVTTPVFIAA
jgi:hypothetical protein